MRNGEDGWKVIKSFCKFLKSHKALKELHACDYHSNFHHAFKPAASIFKKSAKVAIFMEMGERNIKKINKIYGMCRKKFRIQTCNKRDLITSTYTIKYNNPFPSTPHKKFILCDFHINYNEFFKYA